MRNLFVDLLKISPTGGHRYVQSREGDGTDDLDTVGEANRLISCVLIQQYKGYQGTDRRTDRQTKEWRQS